MATETIRVSRAAIFAHIGRGRLTLQVPDTSIGYEPDDMEDMPVEWFTRLVVGRGLRTALGRERGYLFLSWQGWLQFRGALLRAYPGDGEALKQYVGQHFRDVADNDVVEYKRRLARAEEKPAPVRRK